MVLENLVTDVPDLHNARCIAFLRKQIVLLANQQGVDAVPSLAQICQLEDSNHTIHLLEDNLKGERWFTVQLSNQVTLSKHYCLQDLRMVAALGDADLFMAAGKARQILEWNRNHQFCGRCGGPTKPHTQDRAKECSNCSFVTYPRISPCIIALIYRGSEILLARSPHFPAGMFSTLAGFVEVGETLEMTLHREIKEEVGLNVTNIEYFGSQPWPFPHSLMVGFFAEYASGEIVTQDDEIEEAYWWSLDNLPIIPPRGSISRHLIDAFIAKKS